MLRRASLHQFIQKKHSQFIQNMRKTSFLILRFFSLHFLCLKGDAFQLFFLKESSLK